MSVCIGTHGSRKLAAKNWRVSSQVFRESIYIFNVTSLEYPSELNQWHHAEYWSDIIGYNLLVESTKTR